MSRRLKSERQALSCPLNTRTQTMRFRQAAIEYTMKNGVTKNRTLPRRPTDCLPPDRSSANLPRCVVSVSAALKPLRSTASAHPPVFCALRRKESLMPSRVSQPTAVRNSPTARTIPKPIALHALRKRFPSPVSCTNASDPIAPGTTAGGKCSRRRDGEGFRASHGFCSFAGFSSRRALRRRRYYNFPHASSAPMFPKQVLNRFASSAWPTQDIAGLHKYTVAFRRAMCYNTDEMKLYARTRARKKGK